MSPIERWDPDTGQLVERRSHPLTPWASTAAALMFGAVAYWGMAVGSAVSGGGDVLYPTKDTTVVSAPATPSVYATIMPGDTSAFPVIGAFSGSGADTLLQSIFHWDTVTGDFSTPVTADTVNVPLTRDTTYDLLAGGVYKVRAQHVGGIGGASAWSAPDTFTATYSAGAVFWQWDDAAGAFPLAGFDNITDTIAQGTHVSRHAGTGEGGEASYRWSTDDTAYANPGAGQPYVGWGKTFANAAPFAYGDTVYLRWRQRWGPNANCQSWNTGDATTLHRSKLFIFGDNGGSNNVARVIGAVWCDNNFGDSVAYRITRANNNQVCNSDGTIGGAYTHTHASDTTWVDFQYQLVISSAENVADGEYAFWIDNNTYGSPTCRATTSALAAAGYTGQDSLLIVNVVSDLRTLKFGFYWNNPQRAPNGNIVYEFTDIEVDTVFDATWNR